MTNDELNRKISEWMGIDPVWYCDNAPDYCNDLNATRAAAMRIDPELIETYLDALMTICGTEWDMVNATALQRAQALEKVIG